jgi:hypothetical protein
MITDWHKYYQSNPVTKERYEKMKKDYLRVLKRDNPSLYEYKMERKRLAARKWYEKNREIILTTEVMCPTCNYLIKKKRFLQHVKTKKHQNNLKKKSLEDIVGQTHHVMLI